MKQRKMLLLIAAIGLTLVLASCSKDNVTAMVIHVV